MKYFRIFGLFLSFAPAFTAAQSIEVAPQPPVSAPYYQPTVAGPIAPNTPSRKRTLLPAFGIATPRAWKPVWFGIDVGAYYGQYERMPYADLYFTPYLRLWYLTLAYDLTMRFDFYSAFVTKTWTDPEALISRISLRMAWNNPKENAVFRSISLNISTNNNISLGHGRFFYSYDAAPFAPTETLKTASFSMDASYVGMNAYIANIARPDLFGAELFIRPLYWIRNSKISYIRDLRIYAVYAADTDSAQGIYNGFYDFSPSANPTALHSIEVGIEIPLASKAGIFLLTGYGDFSGNTGAASGFAGAGGLIFTFGGIFPIRIEYAQGSGRWSPHFADVFYTADRPNFAANGVNRPSKAGNMTEGIGWYTVALGVENPKRSLFFTFEMSGDSALKDFQMCLSLVLGQQMLKIFSLDLSVTARNLLGTRPFDIANDIAASITARYHMQPNMSWELLWRIRGLAGTSFSYTADGLPVPGAGVTLYQFLGLGFSYRY